MHRFKRVLVVCGETEAQEHALARVRWLAEANGASVTLVDLSGAAAPAGIAGMESPRTGDRIRQEPGVCPAARLEALADLLRAGGIEVATLQCRGPALIGMVEAGDHDLVVKAAEGTGATARLDVMDMHLLRACPCPVWILKAGETPGTARILAAIDPDPENPVRDGLNRLVLELATSLAERDDAELHVLNVWRLREEAALRQSMIKLPAAEVDRILEAEERQSAWRLDRLMKDFAAFPGRIVLRHQKGVAADVIPAYAEAAGIDTLVMGTMARTGAAGGSSGTTAETVLGHVTCSVLTVKPQGFVSPMEPS